MFGKGFMFPLFLLPLVSPPLTGEPPRFLRSQAFVSSPALPPGMVKRKQQWRKAFAAAEQEQQALLEAAEANKALFFEDRDGSSH